MLNPPNSLSFLRAPLALLFIIDNTTLRTVTILLAMLTDCIDGYLARRYRYTSRFGAVLDPIMDKFFVYVAMTVLIYDQTLLPWQAATMLARDFFLFLFAIYLIITGTWKVFRLQAIRWGKVATASQFIILTALVTKFSIPNFAYYFFILFGFLSFIELIQISRRMSQEN